MSERHGDDFEHKVTPHWIGYIVRRKLGLRTERHTDGYRIADGEAVKLARLYEKYGLTAANMNSMNSMNFEEGKSGPETSVL